MIVQLHTYVAITLHLYSRLAQYIPRGCVPYIKPTNQPNLHLSNIAKYLVLLMICYNKLNLTAREIQIINVYL